MTHIAIIGECMIELNGAPFGNMLQSYGGDTLNAAIYLNRSLKQDVAFSQVRTSYVTALGTDSISQEMTRRWQNEGISTDLVLSDPKRSPGLYLIQLDDEGERTFLYWRNDSAARYMVQHPKFTDVMTQLSNADMVFFSGISLAILPNSDRFELLAKIDKLRNNGVKTAFDSNYRPKLWESISATKEAYLLAYQATDIALVTFDDEQLIWQDKSPQDTIARLHKLGVQIVVVKMGSEGCLISENPNQDPVPIPTKPVTNVVDTTSAGDSFNGGFLSAYLAGADLITACQRGNQLAGVVIQHRGAIISKEFTQPALGVV